MYQHFFCNSTFFNYAAFRSDVTFEYCDTASFAIGVFNGADNIGTSDFCVFNKLTNGFAGNGHAGFFDKFQFVQFVHNSADTASFVKVDDVVAATGAKFGKVRSFLGDFVEKFQGQVNASFVSDCRQMKCSVGAASNSHINGNSVFKCFSGHNVARTDIFF